MVKRAYGGTALFPSYKKSKVMAQVRSYRRSPGIKPEQKSHNHTINTTLHTASSISTGTQVISVSSIGPGTEAGQRVGRSISMKWIEFTMDFELGATSIEYDNGFVALIQDRRPNGGAAPTIQDIYVSSPTFGSAIFSDIIHPGRFTELYRANWTVDIAKQYVHRIHKRVYLKDRISTFKGNSSTDYESNVYYLVYASTDTGNVAFPTKARGISVMRFCDA